MYDSGTIIYIYKYSGGAKKCLVLKLQLIMYFVHQKMWFLFYHYISNHLIENPNEISVKVLF